MIVLMLCLSMYGKDYGVYCLCVGGMVVWEGDVGVWFVRWRSNLEGEDFGCVWCVFGGGW